jgi:hypothetical protein
MRENSWKIRILTGTFMMYRGMFSKNRQGQFPVLRLAGVHNDHKAGVHKFSENILATAKFWAPEG